VFGYREFFPVKILVVDDHEVVRKGVCTILTTHFQPEICEEAANGREAITKAVALQPDLIVMDINMPILGGFAAAQEIQRLMPQVPVLFLTMHGGEQFASEARKAGVQGFVTKDRAGEELVDAVKTLLNNRTYFR
jgi:two-component system, NarL family, response regulator NreC